MPAGSLYLIPVTLGGDDVKRVIPDYNIGLICTLSRFIAEDPKTARRFLKLCNYPDLSKAEISELNQHTSPADYKELTAPLLKGESIGLMSDAGCPGVADPGAEIVKLAHRNTIKVVPLVGPSSILLSIMGSGFNGQQFAFSGYLPIEKPQRAKRLRELEQLAGKQNQSQFFIETPYRNAALFEDILSTLNADTLLSLSVNVTLPDELILTKTIGEWKKNGPPDFNKKPAVFGIYRS
ncbi:MAG: SAM-dependent methyltransferase [Bacteroidia bacterium]